MTKTVKNGTEPELAVHCASRNLQGPGRWICGMKNHPGGEHPLPGLIQVTSQGEIVQDSGSSDATAIPELPDARVQLASAAGGRPPE